MPYLPDLLLLLAAAVVIITLFRFLRLSPVLGYLVAGAAIGPDGFSIIKDINTASGIAEVGVVFLLFVIGLELTFERLRAMRKYVFGFGGLQLLLTGGLLGGIAVWLGHSHDAAIIIGGALALSSTALVLQVLAENHQQSSQVGRLSLAVLLMQDFAVVPLLVLVPLLAGDGSNLLSALGNAGMKAVLALAGIFIVGRLLLRPLFRLIATAGNEEVFAAFTLLIVLGTAWITESAGLSLALGAFMAGLLVAETEYVHQVEADILPYKGLLLGLFFMTVGMSVDLQLVLSAFDEIVLYALGLMALKALVLLVVCWLFRFPLACSFHASFLLSQGGEFAFVLFSLAGAQGVLEPQMSQFLMVVVTLSMALTPPVAMLGKMLGGLLTRRPAEADTAQDISQENSDLEQHVVIIGFGRMGHLLAGLLTVEGQPFTVVDYNPKKVREGRDYGLPVYYGNANNADVLEAVGLDRCSLVAVTENDFERTEKIVASVRSLRPDVPIVAVAKGMESPKRLEEAGADIVMPKTLEAGLQLGRVLMELLNIPEHEITRVTESYRKDDYALARQAVLGEKAALAT